MFERGNENEKRCRIVVVIDLYHSYFSTKFKVILKYTSLLKTFDITQDSVFSHLFGFIVVMLLGKL